MTSRNTKRAPAKSRPARMSVARAVAKGPAPTGSPPDGRTPLTGAAHESSIPVRKTRARGSATAIRADQKRLADLKVKLGDPEYMNGAILRIATVLSARLTLR
jgi:hypothetical protein